MARNMENVVLGSFSTGLSQSGVRNHNERLLLSLVQVNGALPASELARLSGLSPPTVSAILRSLEADDLLLKGEPTRGKVGKPSVPMRLNPEGVLSIGFKLGRRNSEVALIDMCGTILFERHVTYEHALPKGVFGFIRDCIEEAKAKVGPALARKICGVGIAAPFEIWKWGSSGSNTPVEFLSWKDIVFEDELARITDLPVFMVNDATAACWAENVYGRGREFRNYAHFFISTFIGGGIVLNSSVFEGPFGNAGAFGQLRVGDMTGQVRPLLDVASIYLLEDKLAAAGQDHRQLWQQPQDWSPFEAAVDDWIMETAHGLAQACISTCAVIDFEAILVEGYVPASVKTRIVAAIRERLPQEDSRGVILPRVEKGTIGGEARALGAASGPIFAQYLLNTNVGRISA